MISTNEFKQRIKNLCKTKEKKVPKEKMYYYRNLKVVENTITGDISICEVESLGYDHTEFRKMIGANDIESGEQVAEYVLQALPAGRCCFGGYTNKQCNTGKKLYSFQDVWYKLYGKSLEAGKEFTKSELLAISSEMKEKFKDAKYGYIYSIKSKYDDIKCLTQYLSRKNSEVKMFEMIDNQYILTDSYLMYIAIPEFKMEEIKSMGISRVYSMARFTKEACTQIIENYERGIEQEIR